MRGDSRRVRRIRLCVRMPPPNTDIARTAARLIQSGTLVSFRARVIEAPGGTRRQIKCARAQTYRFRGHDDLPSPAVLDVSSTWAYGHAVGWSACGEMYVLRRPGSLVEDNALSDAELFHSTRLVPEVGAVSC